MSPNSSGRSSASGSTSSSEADPAKNRGLPISEVTGRVRYASISESSRPRAVSDSVNNKGPVSKVIDLFRNRSNSAVSAEEKRRAVSMRGVGDECKLGFGGCVVTCKANILKMIHLCDESWYRFDLFPRWTHFELLFRRIVVISCSEKMYVESFFLFESAFVF